MNAYSDHFPNQTIVAMLDAASFYVLCTAFVVVENIQRQLKVIIVGDGLKQINDLAHVFWNDIHCYIEEFLNHVTSF